MGTTYLDGPFSPLQPESVIRSIVTTLRSTPTQPGGRSARSRRTTAAVHQARIAFGDLVGAAPEDVVLGSSRLGVQQQLIDLLAADWRLGDEIVLSRLDSGEVLLPWQRAARMSGAVVQWAEVDLETGELPAWQYDQLINARTRLVTVPLANPATGSLPDVSAIASLAHAHGALVLIDLGAAVPHLVIDMTELGADLVLVNAAAFGGPTVAAMAARPGLLREIHGGARNPDPRRFEAPLLPVELLGGAVAAVDHLAGLDEFATGTRRERLALSVSAVGDHTAGLWGRFVTGLFSLPHVTLLGAPGSRVPVFAFTVDGMRPEQVADALARAEISVWSGPSDLDGLLAAFGADELGGVVFAGFMPHTTVGEVDQLLDALSGLAAG